MKQASSSRDVAVVFAAKAWMIIAGIVVQGVLAWFLAPEGRGAYAVCWIFAMTLSLFFSLASDRAAQFYVMSRQQTLSEGVAVALAFSLLGSLAAVAIGYLLIVSGFSYFDKASRSDFLLSLALIPLFSIEFALSAQLAGLRNFVKLGIIGVARTALNVALFVFFLWEMGLGVKGGLLSQIITLSMLNVTYLFVLRRWCGLRFELPKLMNVISVLSYGGRYYIARVGRGMDRNLGTVLLGFMAPQDQIGIFAAALAMTFRAQVFSQSIEIAIVPRIAEGGPSQAPLAERGARIAGYLTFATITILVLFSYPIVRVVLSPEFLPAVPLIWILAIGTIVFGYSKLLMTMLRAIDRPGAVSWIIATSLIVNGAALLALYPIIGASAAAWSMVLGMLARTLMIFAFYKHATGRNPLKALVPRRDDFVLMKSKAVRALDAVSSKLHLTRE